MLIVLHPDVTSQAQASIESRVRELGFTPHAISGAGRTTNDPNRPSARHGRAAAPAARSEWINADYSGVQIPLTIKYRPTRAAL